MTHKESSPGHSGAGAQHDLGWRGGLEPRLVLSQTLAGPLLSVPPEGGPGETEMSPELGMRRGRREQSRREAHRSGAPRPAPHPHPPLPGVGVSRPRTCCGL